ncbi:hypothetical protein AVEN_213936-1 [Araneus ventricosus]|uniref:Uncharacterized protein n=1 Tax=Araneus ventricosus TaxID=182803 RepID=A0A4Y2PWA1_ARAVE|nr:hypothetical protein AVEN_213936-1 [Araneus ventricosus]
MHCLTVIYSSALSPSSVFRCYLRECTFNDHHVWLACGLSEKWSTLLSWEGKTSQPPNFHTSERTSDPQAKFARGQYCLSSKIRRAQKEKRRQEWR